MSSERGKIMNNKTNITVPVYQQYLLTITEAAAYFRIGQKKLHRIAEENPDADFILMNGNRVLFKRKLFEEYLDSAALI